MIPRRYRLPRHGFAAMRTLPRSTGPHLTVFFDPQASQPGIGIIVSKKVAKRAVDRNRVKRILRAAIAPYATPTRAIIVLARTGAAGLSSSELAQELMRIIDRTTTSAR